MYNFIGNETIMTEMTIAPLTTLKLTAKPDTWKAIGQGEPSPSPMAANKPQRDSL